MTGTPLEDRSAAASERGRRRANQDAVLLAALPDGAELAAVADGMGGNAGGEVASSLALTTLREALAAGAELGAAVRSANHAVLAEAAARPELRGMGTTLVAVLRRGDSYRVANVGDSRAYRVDARGITQLTRDHSFVAEAVRSGQLTAEAALQSQWRNAVTRAVGTEAELEVDEFGPFAAADADALLLCSDGLYRVLPDETLRRIVLAVPDPAHAVQQLSSAALDAGSDDNVSVALLRLRAPVAPAEPAEAAPAAASTATSRPAEAAPALTPPSTPLPVPPSEPRAARGPAGLPTRRPWPVELGAGQEPERRVGWTSKLAAVIFGGVVLAILYVALLR